MQQKLVLIDEKMVFIFDVCNIKIM